MSKSPAKKLSTARYLRKVYKYRRNNGLCTRHGCDKRAEPEKSMCSEHMEEDRQRKREYWNQKAEERKRLATVARARAGHMKRIGTNFQLARSVAATGSYPSRIPTLLRPAVIDPATATGQVAIPLSAGIGGVIPCGVLVSILGTGDDDATLSARIIAWKRIHGSNQENAVYVPMIQAEFDAVLGTAVGPGGPLPATYRFADTLTLTAATGEPVITADTTNQGTIVRYSPTGNLIAWARIEDLNGCEMLEVIFNLGTATGANALISFLE